MKENSRAARAGRRVIGRALFVLLLGIGGGVLALWLQSSFAVVALDLNAISLSPAIAPDSRAT